jgi:hypothetical protein
VAYGEVGDFFMWAGAYLYIPFQTCKRPDTLESFGRSGAAAYNFPNTEAINARRSAASATMQVMHGRFRCRFRCFSNTPEQISRAASATMQVMHGRFRCRFRCQSVRHLRST